MYAIQSLLNNVEKEHFKEIIKKTQYHDIHAHDANVWPQLFIQFDAFLKPLNH